MTRIVVLLASVLTYGVAHAQIGSYLVSTVAGNFSPGFSGDGGLATAGQLNNPQGVAVDTLGNLYIADMGNNRVRVVSPDGIINTIAGTGKQGFAGDRGPATSAQLSLVRGVAVDGAGNVFVADSGNRRIRRITRAGIIDTVAGNTAGTPCVTASCPTSSDIGTPVSVAVDKAGVL